MSKTVAFADGLESLTASLGTARDKATSVAYVETYIDDQQLTAAYKTSWLAKKIVDIPANDTFRRWRNWQAEEDQIEKLEKLEKKLAIKDKMLRAYTLARLYGCCYVYFDLGDKQSEPADPTKVKLGGIRFATVLTHRQLSPGEIEQDALSDQFGKPKWFDVVGPTTAGVVRIHPSRVIVLLGSESPDENLLVGGREGYGFRLGTSILSATLPAIKHFDSVAANIASLVFEAKIDVIKVKGLMQIAGNPYEERKLLARYALAATAKGNNGMLILDGDMEEYEQKTYSFAALPDIMDRFSQNASGAADVPLSRLFGKAHSGIGTSGAGENDTRNYYDHLSANQELSVTPAMESFDECLIYAALGSRPPEIHYLWASLRQNSDKERSELGRTGVATIKTLKDTGLIPDEVLARGAVNMLTQAGVIPGLEAEYAAYFEGGGEAPWDMAEEGEDGAAEAMVPQKKPKPGKPGVLTDEQARVPAGSPQGGQFGKGTGAGNPDLPSIDDQHVTNNLLLDQFAFLAEVKGADKTALSDYSRAGQHGEFAAAVTNGNLTPRQQASFDALDRMTTENVVGVPFVYRGIKSTDIREDNIGFLSTTISPDVASQFAGDSGTVMEIKAPPGGFKGIYLEGRYQSAKAKTARAQSKKEGRRPSGELEVLLQRGLRIREVGTRTELIRGVSVNVVQMEIAPFGDEQARAPKGSSIGGQWVGKGSGSSAAGSREELKALVASGASRDVIDSHIALLSVIEEMEKREATSNKPGYDSQEWHDSRSYKVNGKDIKGTEAAMEAWETQANELAWKETNRTVEPILYEKELTIVLGPPAAGKSTIANELAVTRRAMILDSDEIKKSLPEFDRGAGAAAVHEESSELAKNLQALAIAKGSNVVLPKVGDHPASIQKTVDLYKAAGYTVSVVNMSVTPENAYKRNISRFVDTGRIVPPSYLDFVGSKPSATYQFLKLNNMADGFADLDNNGGFTDPKPILSQQGINPLRGTRFAAPMN